MSPSRFAPSTCLFAPLLLLAFTALSAQESSTYVDTEGVIRWSENDHEVHGFGINYTVPFAHAYRSAERMGLDPKRMIDRDVYHFARLGFDLYRVHVWDTEISDTLGNLLANEHLDAFDYLLAELGKRDINYVLTPIAYWGNGWPEPDEATPGFSAKYGKAGSLTEPDAIRAQENYLRQFMEHVNPYTGRAYADDPRLLAVEISNEPHHRESPDRVTEFVRRMREAVAASGTEKPVFYNVSHSVHLMEDYFAAGIRGGTFQWYPTGLGYQRALPFNVLPNVDNYAIPFDSTIRAVGGAKIVYEFDAADVNAAYPYPAMARSFRTAGIQLATHFSYDPTYLAYANTEYNTHYMNLLYTPQKAIGLMIAAEVFRQVPRYADFGSYPADTTFGDFGVSYQRDLSFLNDGVRYYHSNDFTATPDNPDSLHTIAGYGNSPLVKYDGAGAYFLDRLHDGIWRLEVLPDALQVRDAYGRNSPDKILTVLQENERSMRVALPGLAPGFRVSPLNVGNAHTPQVEKDRFTVRPGVYMLSPADAAVSIVADSVAGVRGMREYAGISGTIDRTYVIHEAPPTVVADEPVTLTARVASPAEITAVRLLAPFGPPIEMERCTGFTYRATLPADRVRAGYLDYYLQVITGDSLRTFPSDTPGSPYAWDAYRRDPYRVRVIPEGQGIRLFSAHQDRDLLSVSRWSEGLSLVPAGPGDSDEFVVDLDTLYVPDPENLDEAVTHDYAIRHYLRPLLSGLREELAGYDSLVINARGLYGAGQRVEVGLTLTDGSTYATLVELPGERREVVIALADLQPAPTALLPGAYPTFLPKYYSSPRTSVWDPSEMESLQIRIGPGLAPNDLAGPHGIGLISVDLR